MFWKGFVCGWVGMAVIVMFLVWGVTPQTLSGTETAEYVYLQEC